ncbi:MAG: phosphoribosylformylglycinamidine synthase subunit PurL [Ignavibacteriae bacterium]|nr:phosphoribosylformylglycinamidine synthase subunit PurL [Ignavibacteriota bacterium]
METKSESKTVREPMVTLELAIEHGLTEEEYSRILEILGRIPTYTELGIYSVMWSEHCSYKNSIAVLETLPRSGGRLLVSAGEENAGLVDIGDGLAVAFKIESHNHPSAVEPYQGAATGVGGIMRDIFTMGARPIAALNSLRFGELDSPRTKYLFKGVVKGIGDYGNSFGVPTVAGEVYFEPCYEENPLVNAMAVGLVKHGEWASAVAKGSGNPVMIVGSATGRDGIHGATFASEEITSESESRRPSVQVGDPFTEKLLLEASLEAIRSGYLVGIQDMGAAGITCSTSEMSARGKSGMRINLDRIPRRELGMSAYELMLSESQERMLVVVKRGHEEDVAKIFSKWDVQAEIIGEVTDNDRLVVWYEDEIVADVPAESLVLGGGAPVYTREAREPEYLRETRAFDPASLPVPTNMNAILLDLVGSPNIASKRWVYEQYDGMVRTNSVVLSEADAAVCFIKGSLKGLALKVDCNSRYVYLNPQLGGMIAVAEAARNVVCTGAIPLAITNCLNFGNPYKPEVYWQFKEAVRGIGEACRALNTPVTGGNVSFYNESPSGSVYPTPVIGMLGLVEDVTAAVTATFKNEGDLIVLIGSPTTGHVGGSEYLAVAYHTVAGDAPPIDLDCERRLQQCCLDAIGQNLLKSAHDCSEGGLAVAVAECCIISRNSFLGAEIFFRENHGREDLKLFGEDQSRIVVTIEERNLPRVLELTEAHNIPMQVIGTVGGSRLRINDSVDLMTEAIAERYEGSLSRRMGL